MGAKVGLVAPGRGVRWVAASALRWRELRLVAVAQRSARAQLAGRWCGCAPGGVRDDARRDAAAPADATCARSAATPHPSEHCRRYCAAPTSDRHAGVPSAYRCLSGAPQPPVYCRFQQRRRQSASRPPETSGTACGRCASLGRPDVLLSWPTRAVRRPSVALQPQLGRDRCAGVRATASLANFGPR